MTTQTHWTPGRRALSALSLAVILFAIGAVGGGLASLLIDAAVWPVAGYAIVSLAVIAVAAVVVLIMRLALKRAWWHHVTALALWVALVAIVAWAAGR